MNTFARTGWRAGTIRLALGLMLGVLMIATPAVSAQEASPTAPLSASCTAPALPDGTPTAAIASPEPAMGDQESNATGDETGAPEPDGTFLEADEAAAAIAGAQNLVNCLETDSASGLALMTPHFLLMQFGTGNPHDILAIGGLEGIAFQDFATRATYSYPDGRVSVDVQYRQGAYQIVGERWFFVADDGFLKIDDISPITPVVDGDTTVIGVSLVEYAFEFSVASVVQTDVLMLHTVNAGMEAHEMVIFRQPEGLDLDQITADPETTLANAQFVGVLVLPEPGQQADLVLVNLEPGNYVVICALPAPDGTPHYLKGMIGGFEIVGL